MTHTDSYYQPYGKCEKCGEEAVYRHGPLTPIRIFDVIYGVGCNET